MNIENDIQVSVCVVTYNQENYIAECLESLVNQVTNFRYEIIVGEDCSTDGTRAIVQRYVEKYPDLIVPLFYKENLGPVENIKQVYKKAKGKYIAHMDGDDIALPGKLQKQFDILEKNPDCSICVHNMDAIDKDSINMKKYFNTYEEGKYGILSLYLDPPFFIHSSKMFVNKINEYLNELNNNALDTELHIEQAKQGDIYYLNDNLGQYRQFVGVTFENKFISLIVRERIEFIYENLDKKYFSNDEIDKIETKYAKTLLEYAYQCSISIQDKNIFTYYVNKSIKIKKINKTQYLFKFACFFPILFFKIFAIRSKMRSK